ncbi:hypothetical protein RCL1_007046 [Eukaryota sp. TZLM3-RCL]
MVILSSSDLHTFLDNLVKEPSHRSLRRFARLFFSVCHSTDEVDDEENDNEVLLESIDDHQTVMIFALLHLRTIFDSLLSFTDNGTAPSAMPMWNSISRSVKIIIAGLMHFVSSVHNANNSDIVNYVLLGAASLSPYLCCFPALSKIAVSSALKLWTQEPDEEEETFEEEENDSDKQDDDQINQQSQQKSSDGASLPAFAFLSSLLSAYSSSSDPESLRTGIKILTKAVEEYLAVARFTSKSSLKFHNFLLSSLTSLFESCPLRISYNVFFTTLRDSARVLRSAMLIRDQNGKVVSGEGGKKKKGKTDFYSKGKKLTVADLRQKALSATQFARLRFLSSFLTQITSSPSFKDFKLLIQPLFTILIGTAHLANSPQCAPSRLICIELITKISKKSGVYCPICTIFSSFLRVSSFVGKLRPVPKKTNLVDLTTTLRASDGTVGTLVLANPVLTRVAELAREYLIEFKSHPAFPEMVSMIVVDCKNALKTVDKSLAPILSGLLDELSSNATFIRQSRVDIDFPVVSKDRLIDWVKDNQDKCPMSRVLIAKQLKKDSQKRLSSTIKKSAIESVSVAEPTVKKPRFVEESDVKEEKVVDLVLSDDE